jgi:hypothetical protein
LKEEKADIVAKAKGWFLFVQDKTRQIQFQLQILLQLEEMDVIQGQGGL